MFNFFNDYKKIKEEANIYNKFNFVKLFIFICIFFTLWIVIGGGILKNDSIVQNFSFGLLGMITPLSIPIGCFLLLGVFVSTPMWAILIILVIAFDYFYIDILWAKFKIKNLFFEIIFKILILIISSMIIEWAMYGSLCSLNMINGNIIKDNSGADGFQRGDGCWPLESSM